jgi:hypothetical protein
MYETSEELFEDMRARGHTPELLHSLAEGFAEYLKRSGNGKPTDPAGPKAFVH